ncbi:MAG: IPT/TIG domain-containing protein [Myxococcota bacterium]
MAAVFPSEGAKAGGYPVTLKGQCLSTVTEVYIGSNKLEQLEVTFSQIVGIAPPGLIVDVPVNVSAVNSEATDVLPRAFTYRDNFPCVTKVTPSVGCPGDRVVVTGEHFKADTKVFFAGVELVSAAGMSTPNGIEVWGEVPPPAGSDGPVEVSSANPGGRTCVKPPIDGLFSYNLDPEITEVAPDAGPMNGGVPVEIRGRCLSNVQSATIGGAELLARSSPDSKTIRGVLPRRSPQSSTDVTVDVKVETKIDQTLRTYNRPNGFTYQADDPYVTSFAPTTGCEGDVIQVFGGNFNTQTTVLVGGRLAPAEFISAGELLVTIPSGVTDGGTASNQVHVMVINSAGFNSLPGFTYDDTPEVKSISPAVDVLPGGQPVTIEGRCFLGAPTTELEARIGSNAVTSMQVLSPKKLTGSVPAGTAPGYADVTVESKVLQLKHTLSNAFYYLDSPPTLTSLGADAGCVGDTLAFNGTGFAPSTTVTFSFPDGGVAGAQNVSVSSPTQLTATVPSGAHGTAATVTVATALGQASLPGAFTYDLTPKVTSVTPSAGPVAGNTPVSIGGQCFVNVSAARIAGLDLFSRKTVSPTEITGNTRAVMAPGTYDVEVTTPIGTARLDGGFTYIAAPPTVTSVTPDRACEDREVIIEGTNFVTGTLVSFGATQVVPSIESLTRMRVTIPQLPPGQHTVTAGNSATGSGSLVNGFTYDLTPEILSILPPTGLVGEQTAVTINGRCLRGTNTVTFGTTAATIQTVTPPNKVQVLSPALTTAGFVDVTVATPSGSKKETNGFRYLIDRPHVVFNQYAPVIKAADLNNDGHQDLILGEPTFNNNAGRVRVFMGNGAGAFTAGVTLQEQPPASNQCFGGTLEVGHLDSNTFPDLAVGSATFSAACSPSPNWARIYRSNGTGDFLSPILLQGTLSADSQNDFGTAFAIADFDADGDGDLAIGAPRTRVATYTTPQNGMVYLYYNVDGDFSVRRMKPIFSPDNAPLLFGFSLAAAPIDGDPAGTFDLVISRASYWMGWPAGVYNHAFRIYQMPARGTAGPNDPLGDPVPFLKTWTGGNTQLVEVRVGDIDAIGGSNDVFIALQQPSTLYIYRPVFSAGVLTDFAAPITRSGWLSPGGFAFGDLNGDSFDDVYLSNPSEAIIGYSNAGRAYVHLSNGDGTFQTLPPFQERNLVAHNRYYGWGPGLIADLDGDGINDLMIGDGNQGQFWIYFGPNLVY